MTSNFPFPTVFSTCLENLLPFSSNLKVSAERVKTMLGQEKILVISMFSCPTIFFCPFKDISLVEQYFNSCLEMLSF